MTDEEADKMTRTYVLWACIIVAAVAVLNLLGL